MSMSAMFGYDSGYPLGNDALTQEEISDLKNRYSRKDKKKEDTGTNDFKKGGKQRYNSFNRY